MSPKNECPFVSECVVSGGIGWLGRPLRGAVCQGVHELGCLDFSEYDRLKDLVNKTNACALPGVHVKFNEFMLEYY